MIVQNNVTPVIVFALIAMAICGILGAMLGLNPFGPNQEVRNEIARTQMAIEVRGTENAMSAVETPQAIYAQQTAVAAQLTAFPVQQTATQVAAMDVLQNAQFSATQTAIAGEAMNKQLAHQATQTALAWDQRLNALAIEATTTAIAQSQTRQQTAEVSGFVLIGIGVLVLSGWIVARIFIQVIRARAEEKFAQARVLAEQCRLASLQASLQGHNGHKPSYPLPRSLMNGAGDPDVLSKLPKAK